MTTPLIIAICALLLWSAWFDAARHRIPNAVVLLIFLCGLGSQILLTGLAGAASALGGTAVGLLMFLPFYVRGGMGAGDVKLMAAVGALLGPLGAVLAVGITLVCGFVLTVATVWISSITPTSLVVHKNGVSKVPYAAAIAAGGGMVIWTNGHLRPVFGLLG